MSHVAKVNAVQAYTFEAPDGARVAIAAQGIVNTSGWSSPRLSPRYYVRPPDDGIWDFDFTVDPPCGLVLEVEVPVSAHFILSQPDWLKGVRVHAASNSLEAALERRSTKDPEESGRPHHFDAHFSDHVIYNQTLAVFDDSFQPTGNTKFDPWPHAEMKKLRHELILTVKGPDEAKIRSCLQQGAILAAIAAIAAAAGTGGAALPAAVSAFTSSLVSCLGESYDVRIDDRSHWIYWWT